MSYTVEYTRSAERDIDQLFSYLSDTAGTETARRLLAQIIQSVESLTDLPFRHEKYDLLDRQCHVIPVSSWRVWYRVRGSVVSIDRVLHKRQMSHPDLSSRH